MLNIIRELGAMLKMSVSSSLTLARVWLKCVAVLWALLDAILAMRWDWETGRNCGIRLGVGNHANSHFKLQNES